MNHHRPYKSSHHARKHHDQDRVRAYTNPAVCEVIYADEWDGNQSSPSEGKITYPCDTSGKVSDEEWEAYRAKLHARDRINMLPSPWFYLILVGCAGIAYLLLV